MYQPLDGFDTYFSSAVAVRECHRAKAMVDPPIVYKLPGSVGNKLGTTICDISGKGLS